METSMDSAISDENESNNNGNGQQQQQQRRDTDNEPTRSIPPTTRVVTNEYVLNFAFFSFIGFVLVQSIFSLIAHSQAMLADSEAMAVDALTYLFNLLAERIKNRPYSHKELLMNESTRENKREIQRLYLELLPPSVSVITLIVVTILTLRDAFHTLRGIDDDNNNDDDDDDVSITIMLIFSGANLLLDIVNVTCFARANLTFGLDVVKREGYSIRESVREEILMPSWSNDTADDTVINESTSLVGNSEMNGYFGGVLESPSSSPNRQQQQQQQSRSRQRRRISSSNLTPQQPHEIVNLNMCSAWTHVCADTLRSIAVLIAAGLACLFPKQIQPDVADSVAAVIVSFIILGSLLPLLQGLCLTALELHSLLRTGNNKE